MFISQKCSKYCNLSSFHINSIFVFFRVSYLSTAKGPYAAICNLSRDIRFKRENLLIISILPGPNEVSLHKINHYLAPMVDELL